jgi:flagellar FliJ protein
MQNILNVKLKLESQAKTAYGIAEQKYQEQQKILQDMLIRRNGYENQLKKLMNGT